MSSQQPLRKPVQTIRVDMSGTPITTAAWVQIVASLNLAAGALEIFNPSGSSMIISSGPAGHESEAVYLFPWTIIPGGSTGLVPLEMHAHTPLSLKAVDVNASLGLLVINLYE